MLFRKLDKERDRYYLLPGMGKRLARKKKRRILAWSLAAGLLVGRAPFQARQTPAPQHDHPHTDGVRGFGHDRGNPQQPGEILARPWTLQL